MFVSHFRIDLQSLMIFISFDRYWIGKKSATKNAETIAMNDALDRDFYRNETLSFKLHEFSHFVFIFEWNVVRVFLEKYKKKTLDYHLVSISNEFLRKTYAAN